MQIISSRLIYVKKMSTNIVGGYRKRKSKKTAQ